MSLSPIPKFRLNPQNPQQGADEIYTVKAKDSLSKIAKHFYGDASQYMRIFEANQDQLDDPNKIQVGQKLSIPAA